MKSRIKVNPAISKFFDFYSMYELYLRAGGFREIGYVKYPVFVNERIYRRIEDKYNEIVQEFFQDIYDALAYSVRSELRHFPSHCIEKNNEWNRLAEITGYSKKMLENGKRYPEEYPEIAFRLFYDGMWAIDYGGINWAVATEFLIKAKKIKTTHEKVAWCDAVLDLEHNTGHLLNKTKFRVLSGRLPKSNYSTPLDFRADANEITKFLPYCTTAVRKLVIPRTRILASETI